MTKRNAIAFEVPSFDDPKVHEPGAFVFVKRGSTERGGIVFACPCGCGFHGTVNFAGSGSEPTWTVTGEWPKASLSPSIGFYGPNDLRQGHHWHGYLRNGVFEEC